MWDVDWFFLLAVLSAVFFKDLERGLTGHHVAESDGGQGGEGEVERVDVRPALDEGEEGGRYGQKDDQTGHQVEADVHQQHEVFGQFAARLASGAARVRTQLGQPKKKAVRFRLEETSRKQFEAPHNAGKPRKTHHHPMRRKKKKKRRKRWGRKLMVLPWSRNSRRAKRRGCR